MRNNARYTSWGFVLLAVLALAAFVFSFWPLAALAVAAGALFGAPVVAVVLAFMLDLIYGPPPGALSVVLLPFTAATLLLVGLRHVGARFMLERGSRDTL